MGAGAPRPLRVAVSAVWTGGLAAITAIALLIPPILLARGAPSLDWALERTLY